MRTRPTFRLQALFLTALTLALATGVPSHHHQRSDTGPIVVDAGHHGHGTKLVDQDNRLTSELAATALPAERTLAAFEVGPALVLAVPPALRPVVRGRAPPSDRPRAPPVSA